MGRAAALLSGCAALLALAGCRATPAAPTEDMAGDMAVPTGGGDDFGGGDMAAPDMACPVGPEICGNGCDDDRNGYTDDDDPACTTQMLVTLAVTPLGTKTPALWRLILEPTPHVVVLDGNPVSNGGMPTFNAAFAPAAFIPYDGSTKVLERRPLGGSATTAMPGYTTRDACVFNGELIVVDPRSATSLLHRFKPDGVTEIMPPASVANTASACASDGAHLFVSTHTTVGASQICVFNQSANGPVDSGLVLAIPDAMANAGYTRLIDFAYVKKSGLLIGLFAQPTAVDSSLNSQVMAPFGLDGGVGSFVDGGVWHGVGEFLP